MTEIFSLRLASARQMAGFSMQELADMIGISKQAISKYEKGLMMPESTTLIKMASFLGVSETYFYNETPEETINLVSIWHRDKEKLFEDEMVVIKKQTVDFLHRLFELEKIAHAQQDFKNPVSDMIIKNRKDAEKAAKVVRKKWGLGNGAISNVVNFLEDQGIRVYEVMQSEKFEGFSAWAGKIPVIVINKSIKEITRIRFTALHELGHIVLQIEKELSITDIERICDAFAGELLLPTEILIMELGFRRTRISIEELKTLKVKYGISVKAIMVKAACDSIITWDTFKVINEDYQSSFEAEADFGSYHGIEEPRRFVQLLCNCIMENKVSIGKAASLYNMKEKQFKEQFKLTEYQHN